MSSRIDTHLTLIEDCYNKSPDAVAFQLPQLDHSTGQVTNWSPVSYTDFRNTIVKQALYWGDLLKARGVQSGSVVTLWTSGLEYNDTNLVFGLSRAGYIPQLLSFAIPSAETVYDMAQTSGASALIYNKSKEGLILGSRCPIPVSYCYDPQEHQQLLRNDCTSSTDLSTLPKLDDLSSDPDALAFILHTTGSTSGKPKSVPWTRRCVDHNIKKMNDGCLMYSSPSVVGDFDMVTTWLGATCHAGQLLANMRVFSTCSTTIQPSSLAFSPQELKDMKRLCGLTTLCQYSSLFSTLIAHAKSDPELLALLQALDCIFLGGLPLSQADTDWCTEKGITLQFVFASTECGMTLRSETTEPHNLYRFIEGSSLMFTPVAADPTDSEQGDHAPRRLLELVVPPDSVDCPVPSLCSPSGGFFHTGDLFEEIVPGFYEAKGRTDDWIKLRNSCRCDTRAIEDNVLKTCGGLVANCVATGSARPSIVVFVEVNDGGTGSGFIFPDELSLKEEILLRARPVQAKMWAHEMLLDPRQIRIVPAGSLPRTSTKGNIRRKAVEELFEEELDDLYLQMSVGKVGL